MIIVLISSEIAWGEGEYSLKLTEFNLEVFQYDGRRDPYFPDHHESDWVGGSAVNYTLGVMKYLYFDNTLHFEYDNSPQVRSGGWRFEIGASPFSWLDIYRHHHSRHSFEYINTSVRRFPVEDAYGIRLNLITGKTK